MQKVNRFWCPVTQTVQGKTLKLGLKKPHFRRQIGARCTVGVGPEEVLGATAASVRQCACVAGKYYL